jgi:branched-chain amino acid transport system substrate-binding protein
MKRLLSATMLALMLGAAAALLTAAGFGGSNKKAGGTINIGLLTSLNGPFTAWGLQARDGAQFAVNEVNGSKLLKGRKLNLVVADDQSSPNAGIDGFNRLTQQERVVSIGGLISSDVALATARLAEQAHVPIFLIKAGANEILTSSSRYTFRTCLPAAAEVANPIVQFAQARKVKTVGAVIADYAWGQSVKSSLEAAFAKVPGITLKVAVAPVRTSDFTTYLRSLGGAQMIIATGHPPGSGAILTQSGQLGMKVPVAGAYAPFSATEKAAGTAAYGRWSDFKCQAVGSRGYKALAKRFLKAYPNDAFMEDDALAAYAYVKIVAQAISKGLTNPTKIAAYVHTHTFIIPGYTFPLRWTAWGELAAPRIAFDVLTKGPPPESGLVNGGAWWPRQLSLSKPLTPYRPS